MSKILEKIKKTNSIAIFSFLIAISAWVVAFTYKGCGTISDSIGGIAALLGIVSLIWIRIKKQKGTWLAICGITIGVAAYILLVTLC